MLILLDWSQTLSISRFWEPWFTAEDAVRRDLAHRMAAALFDQPNALLDRWCLGQRSAEQVVAEVAAAIGVDADLALLGLEESCRGMRFLSADLLPLVAALRARGQRIGIATDNMDTFGRWTVPALGLDRWFDPILNSADMGAVKNGPLDRAGRHPFFGGLLDGLAPETRVLLIDDSTSTAPMAEAIGITFCHVTPERDAAAWLREIATK
ncbi:MAG: HAD family hydrolase [Thermomicrobiales bacterium]